MRIFFYLFLEQPELVNVTCWKKTKDHKNLVTMAPSREPVQTRDKGYGE